MFLSLEDLSAVVVAMARVAAITRHWLSQSSVQTTIFCQPYRCPMLPGSGVNGAGVRGSRRIASVQVV